MQNDLRRVLLVEDDDEDYDFAKEMLAELKTPRHELVWARDYRSAVSAARDASYDVCLIDYRLGGVENGIDVARDLIADGRRMPVILLTGVDDREVDETASRIGAADFLVKSDLTAPILERAIRYAIQGHAALRALDASYRATVRGLAAALELRDDGTGAHAARVAELALRLAERVAPELASQPELEYGFLLHDLGKIGVPDAILLKPGPLNPDELERMKRHALLGQRILAQIPYLNGLPSAIALAHHERWDGTGYPNQLRGTDIPLAARIFSIVDAYDAITSDRPYRNAQSSETALRQINQGAGSQFDPQIAETFTDLIRETSTKTATLVPREQIA
jgi:putative two-component system response regulator